MPMPTILPKGMTELELRRRAGIAVRQLGHQSLRDYTLQKWIEAIKQVETTKVKSSPTKP